MQESVANLMEEVKREETNNFSRYNYSVKKKISSNLVSKLEAEFKNKSNLCIICFANELNNSNQINLPCGHSFCTDCVKTYLLNLINNGAVEAKCLMAGCLTQIPDLIIKSHVNLEEYKKFERFRTRYIYANKIQKGYIPCVFPDCEEWLKYEEGDEKFIMCTNGHKFCAKCKENWHLKKNCTIVQLNLLIN